MKTVHAVLIVVRILLVVMVGLYVYLVLRGLTGDVMVNGGVMLLGILLMTRYLAKLYDRYMLNSAVEKDSIKEESLQFLDSWCFDPFDYTDKGIDDYLGDLLEFITARGDKTFVPNEKQRFKIWWEDVASNEVHTTGKVTKMSLTKDGKVKIETTSGVYIGEPGDCIDLIVSKKVHGQDES